jgi:hypothetical protein
MLGAIPAYRPMLVVDVERSAGRGDVALQQNRSVLRAALMDTFRESGLDWDAYHRTDTGDGMRLVFGADVPKRALLHPLVHELAVRLRAHNQTAGELNRIRVRMAVHAGDVHVSDGEVVGSSLELLARLEDSATLRTALRNAPEAVTVALAVSDHIYQEVVRHRYAGIDPATYHRVEFTTKETTAVAWLHLPGCVDIPSLTAVRSEPHREDTRFLDRVSGIHGGTVNIAADNAHVGQQIGTRIDQLDLSGGAMEDSLEALRRQVTGLRQALEQVRHTGQLDEQQYDAAHGELAEAEANLGRTDADGRGRVLTALRKLKGLVGDAADLATRVATAIATARSL